MKAVRWACGLGLGLFFGLAPLPAQVPPDTPAFGDGVFQWPVGDPNVLPFATGRGFRIQQNFHNLDGPVICNKSAEEGGCQVAADYTYTCGRAHAGTDFTWRSNSSEAAGMPVSAAGDGRVLCILPRGYPGRALVVRHDFPDGPGRNRTVYSLYAHLDNCTPPGTVQEPCIDVGATVLRGQRIGKILDQGSNSHLHFEVRSFPYWKQSNPEGPLAESDFPDGPPVNNNCPGRGYSPDELDVALDGGYLNPIDFVLSHHQPLPGAGILDDNLSEPQPFWSAPSDDSTRSTRLLDPGIPAGSAVEVLSLVRDDRFRCGGTDTSADASCDEPSVIDGIARCPAPPDTTGDHDSACGEKSRQDCANGACNWWYQVRYTPPGSPALVGYVQAYIRFNYAGGRPVSVVPLSFQETAVWAEPGGSPLIDYSFDTATGNGRVLPNAGSVAPFTGQVLNAPVVDLSEGLLRLDGNRAYVDVDLSESLVSASGFQFSAEVKRGSEGSEDVIASQWGASTAAQRWIVRFVPGVQPHLNELEFRIRCSPRCSGQTEAVARWVLPECLQGEGSGDPWHRVSGSYSPVGGLRLYWDDRQVARAPLGGGAMATGGRPPLFLGGRTAGTAPDPSRFDGAFDRFRFWGEAPELRPELSAARPTASPTAPVAGQTVNLSALLHNNGAGDAGFFEFVWLRNDTPVSTDSLGGLAVGTPMPIGLSWTALEGTHRFKVRVDTQGDVAESNENNQTSPELVLTVTAAARPDIAVTALTVTGAPLVGATVQVKATLANAGTIPTGDFGFDCTVDDQPLPGAAGTQASLAAGQSLVRTVDWVVPTAGSFNFECTADPAGAIAEVREDNNSKLRSLGTRDALADLRPTVIRFLESEVVPGGIARFDSGVRNDGEIESGSFNIRWLVDGQDVGANGNHISVPAKKTVLNDNSEFFWNVLPGRHNITFRLDYDHQIPELKESNNELTVTVGNGEGVRDVDLDAAGVTTALGTQLYAGNPIDLNSKVINHGGEDSGTFQVRWVVDGVDVGPFPHGSVGPGQTVDFGNSSFRWIASPGQHTIAFEVDSDNRIAETREDNNSSFIVLNVPTGLLPDLKAEALRTVGTVRTGSPVTFELRATNFGAAVGPFGVLWSIDNRPVLPQETFEAGLGEGASKVLVSRLTWTVTEGPHTVYAKLDPANSIAEASETNNRTPALNVTPPLPASLGTYTVPAVSNVFAAGLGFTGSVGGGALPVLVSLPGGTGREITFQVSGNALSCCGTAGPHDADGGTGLATSISSTTEISGIQHSSRNIFLTGVFLSDDPATGPAPARLRYFEPFDAPVIPTSGATSTRLSEYLAPLLQQTFFIGDGVPAAGLSAQRFRVPDGATRLFLGFADGLNLGDPRLGTPSPAIPGFYGDNTGTLTVTVRAVP